MLYPVFFVGGCYFTNRIIISREIVCFTHNLVWLSHFLRYYPHSRLLLMLRCSKLKFFCLIVIFLFRGVLWYELIFNLHGLAHRRGDELVQLFAIGRALFCAREFNSASSSRIGGPGPFHELVLHIHNLARVHVMPRSN